MKTLEEEAEKYAGISEDKYANKALKYCAFDMSDSFEAGAKFAQRWIPINEELPIEFEKQLLVKNENYNYVDLRFFNHKNQFDLLCKIHNYTHWRPLFL